ncbi:MAG: hypothetical protein GEU90_10185 [Gemmatimonas sp.]|nr:hypothetical protein [Gemmatimonas sp.]
MNSPHSSILGEGVSRCVRRGSEVSESALGSSWPAGPGAGSSLMVVLLALVFASPLAHGQSIVRAEAPTDRAVDFPAQVLANEITVMEGDGTTVARLLEGGTHNFNIRHDADITPENSRILTHEREVDVWVVQRGSGILSTGGRMENGQHVDGVERVISAGDVIFIPNGVPHGIKEAKSITWLNLRYVYEDDD